MNYAVVFGFEIERDGEELTSLRLAADLEQACSTAHTVLSDPETHGYYDYALLIELANGAGTGESRRYDLECGLC